MNFLEELVAEWYEFKGYLIRKNIKFGKRPQGGYTGEMDIVAFHPREKSMIHIETSFDADSWEKRIRKLKKKFDNAAKYYQEEFNFEKKEIQKIAIVGFYEKNLGPQSPNINLEVKPVPSLIKDICKELLKMKPLIKAVPEQYPLLRAMQFAIHWNR